MIDESAAATTTDMQTDSTGPVGMESEESDEEIADDSDLDASKSSGGEQPQLRQTIAAPAPKASSAPTVANRQDILLRAPSSRFSFPGRNGCPYGESPNGCTPLCTKDDTHTHSIQIVHILQ